MFLMVDNVVLASLSSCRESLHQLDDFKKMFGVSLAESNKFLNGDRLVQDLLFAMFTHQQGQTSTILLVRLRRRIFGNSGSCHCDLSTYNKVHTVHFKVSFCSVR